MAFCVNSVNERAVLLYESITFKRKIQTVVVSFAIGYSMSMRFIALDNLCVVLPYKYYDGIYRTLCEFRN